MINYNTAIPYLIGIYGEEEQLIKTAEEAAELAQAAIKHRYSLTCDDAEINPKSRQHLAEEIADVLIMIDQIVYAEGFEDDVRKIIDDKIQRQINRIKGVKG